MKSLRIAILPLFGMPTYQKDSNFRVYLDIAIFAEKLGLPIFFYFCVPKITPDLPELKNVKFVEVNMELNDFYGDMGRVPKEMYYLFSRKCGVYPIDVIFTSRTMAIDTLSCSLNDHRRCVSIPIHLFDPLVRVDSTKNKSQIMSMCYGYSKAYNWFLNNDEMTKALSECRKYLSPSNFLATQERSYVNGLPLSIEELDKVLSETKKNDKFTLFWGARMSSEKNPQETAEIMEKFFSFGRDVDLIMTTQQSSPKLMARVMNTGKGAIKEVKRGCPRDEFLKLVSSAHMFLCTSRVEGFPVGFMEQLYLTPVAIFPAKKWVTKLLPKEYPFIYNNISEAHTFVRYIQENYDKAYNDCKFIRNWLRDNYSADSIVRSCYDKMIKSVEKCENKEFNKKNQIYRDLGNNFKVFIKNAIKEFGDEFTYKELIDYIELNADTWKSKRIKCFGSPNVYELHKYVLDNNYYDIADSEYPHYKLNK